MASSESNREKARARAYDRKQLGNDVDCLHQGLLHWFYDRGNLKRARLYADLLENLVQEWQGSIIAEECRSLIAEVRGDLAKAIRHRQHEISLIRRLHEISIGELTEEVIFQVYGYEELSDRLDLLATLYHGAGKLDRAIAVLEESKALCEEHGVNFDGFDLLIEYREERNSESTGR